MTNREIKIKAKELIKGNVLKILVTILLIGIVCSVISGVVENLLKFVFETIGLNTVAKTGEKLFGVELTTPTAVGNAITMITSFINTLGSFIVAFYVLNFVRGKEVEPNDMIEFLKRNVLKLFLIALIQKLVVGLGMVLFIIPGIILALGLSLVTYISIDEESLSAVDTLKKSWELMKGYKGRLFLFGFSFIGWYLLCIFLIPIAYVVPYVSVAEALFYENIKKNTK